MKLYFFLSILTWTAYIFCAASGGGSSQSPDVYIPQKQNVNVIATHPWTHEKKSASLTSAFTLFTQDPIEDYTSCADTLHKELHEKYTNLTTAIVGNLIVRSFINEHEHDRDIEACALFIRPIKQKHPYVFLSGDPGYTKFSELDVHLKRETIEKIKILHGNLTLFFKSLRLGLLKIQQRIIDDDTLHNAILHYPNHFARSLCPDTSLPTRALSLHATATADAVITTQEILHSPRVLSPCAPSKTTETSSIVRSFPTHEVSVPETISPIVLAPILRDKSRRVCFASMLGTIEETEDE